MANGIRAGATFVVPELDGRWSVWSDAADGPGSVFMVPADDKARATRVKYAVVRIKYPDSKPEPEIRLIRTDPSLESLQGASA